MSIPRFGISRKQTIPKNVPAPEESGLLIPVVDLANPPEAKIGAIVLNKGDNLLYYCTTRRWIPLSIANMDNDLLQLKNNNIEIIAPQGGDINLYGGDNKGGNGGRINITSGTGGLGDGEINFEIGKESVLNISQEGEIKVPISTGIIDINNNELVMRGGHMIITINRNIKQDEQVSGIINNSLIQKESWINISVSTDGDGIPHVWLLTPNNGSVEWYLCCLDGVLKNTRLYIEIRNSISTEKVF
jgi:hypothetical protein